MSKGLKFKKGNLKKRTNLKNNDKTYGMYDLFVVFLLTVEILIALCTLHYSWRVTCNYGLDFYGTHTKTVGEVLSVDGRYDRVKYTVDGEQYVSRILRTNLVSHVGDKVQIVYKTYYPKVAVDSEIFQIYRFILAAGCVFSILSVLTGIELFIGIRRRIRTNQLKKEIEMEKPKHKNNKYEDLID